MPAYCLSAALPFLCLLQIEKALDSLLLAKAKDGSFRFAKAICILDNLPSNVELMAKYNLVFNKCCSCNRDSLIAVSCIPSHPFYQVDLFAMISQNFPH